MENRTGNGVKNSFQYGRELGADSLVDRQKEIEEVKATLTEGGKLFLIGPRRYGKTSILKVSAERVEQSGGVMLSFDAEAYPTLELLVRAILAEATARLSGNLPQAGDWARKFFGRASAGDHL
jgi:ABC-type cobalamin/Fe3+-siderophores transport system ATPase subunit